MSNIYIITNDLNDKVYIGYTSQTISRRFYTHCWEAQNNNNDTSYLHKAIRKYGKEHFKISLIESFNEEEKDWKELEKYYIKRYNSVVPNGYNILEGGNIPPVHYGEDNIKTKLSEQDLDKLIIMLKETTIPINKLGELFNISSSQVNLINQGKSRRRVQEKYPIRKYNEFELRALDIIDLLKQGISNKEIAQKYNMKANTIASINTGKLYRYLYNGKYPIREERFPQTQKQKEKALLVINFLKENPDTTKINIQRSLNLTRNVVDKSIAGIAPYKIEGMIYPLKQF